MRRFLSLLVACCWLAAGAAALQTPSPAAAEARTVWAAPGDGATISPDGRSAAYVDWSTGDLALYDLATGASRPLTDKGSWEQDRSWAEPPLVFSPEGDFLAYPFANAKRGDPYRFELRLVAVAGGEPHVLDSLPQDAASLTPLDWHGRAGILYRVVAADESSELRLLRPRRGAARVLRRQRAGSAIFGDGLFTPDGRSVVYLLEGVLHRAALSGGAARDLGLQAEVLLGWSRQGELIFHGTRGVVTGNWAVAWRRGRPAGEPRLLYPTAPGVVRAGRSAAGLHYREPAQFPHLAEVRLDTAQGRVLQAPQTLLGDAPGAVGNPSWSPDGTRLAYTVRTPNRSLYRVMVAQPGKEGVEIARVELALVTGLAWAADGRSLVIAGRGRSRASSWVGRIAAASGKVTLLATAEPTTAVTAGEGNQVAYIRAAGAGEVTVDVVLLDSATAAPHTLATFPVSEVSRSLSISPGGAWVALVKPAAGGDGSVLHLLPASGGEGRAIALLRRPDGYDLAAGNLPWSPDGKRILLPARQGGANRFVIVDVDSGRATPLDLALGPGTRRHPTLHPDGARLVYVEGVTREELRMMPEPAAERRR